MKESALFQVPNPVNERTRDYSPGDPTRKHLEQTLQWMSHEKIDIPCIIGGREIRTGRKVKVVQPHSHQEVLAEFHQAGPEEIRQAVAAAARAKEGWEALPWTDRAAVFLKAADLLAGPWRDRINAATMLGQSKSAYQAEIDAACEMIDFFRFNAHFYQKILADQPISSPGIWNRVDYRPLEGFVWAITPFNFTAIAGNLCAAPAMTGNTVLWKPSDTQMLSAYYTMKLFQEAGLPDGVINFIPADGPTSSQVLLAERDLAGIHFTGSTGTFQTLWQGVSTNLKNYRTYPRVVGETGGKDFVFAHPSADLQALAVALVRGAFEFQGQKCSAASRAYIPRSLWKSLESGLLDMVRTIKMGDVRDLSCFMNAVIDERAFRKISGYIEDARNTSGVKVLVGGKADSSKGFFIEPTVLLTDDPRSRTMVEEIFGPVLTIYVYEDERLDEVLDLCDNSTPYALTGAIFAQDRLAIEKLTSRLRNAAGNFYINDKPTGAVVGQQPFGGARASGTNDKAGSALNLQRWVSPRTIKENLVPPKDYRYPFMS